MERAQIETITPEQARLWLQDEMRPANRRMNELHVRRIAAAISRGEWQVNGETIKFDSSGYLIDGQHRLAAIVRAGKPVQSWVIFGLPQKTMQSIDNTYIRNAAHELQMAGYPNTYMLAATIAQVLYYKQHKVIQEIPNWAAPSRQQQLAFIEAHPEIQDSLRVGDGVGRYKGVPSSVLGALHYLFSEVDAPTTEAFYEKLRTGVGMSIDDPALVLRNKMVKISNTPHFNTRVRREEVAAYIVKAWKAYREGRTIKQLVYRPEREVFPVIEEA